MVELFKESQENRDANRHKVPAYEYVWLCYPPNGEWNSGPSVVTEGVSSHVTVTDLLEHYRKNNYTCHRYKTTGEKVDDYNPPKLDGEPLSVAEKAIIKAWGYESLLEDSVGKHYTPNWIRKNILKS